MLYNVFLFFVVIKKKERFEWNGEFHGEFSRIKTFLTSLPIVNLPKEGPLLLLSLSDIDPSMSLVLVQETEKA